MKKLFGIMALVAIAATAGWNFIQSQNQVELSELALANVEALAFNEWTPDGNSSFFFTYTRCMDCNSSTAVSVWQQERCWH